MQLKKSKSIRRKLALATSSLLLASPMQNIHSAEITDTNSANPENDRIDISRLYYSEKNLVTVEKFQGLISKELNESNRVSVNIVYDTMSGASPNGRIVNSSGTGDSSITYTTASGSANTVAGNGGAVVDTWKTNFEDTRTAINVDWEKEIIPILKTVISGGQSTENDYTANSFGAKALLDLNQRRTTFVLGTAFNFDTVSPRGGIPEGTATITCDQGDFFRPDEDWLDCDSPRKFFKPAEKNTVSYMLGLTQVWNRRTLIQMNFSLASEEGYLTDPYKQVSITNSEFDGEVAVIHEKRPATRQTRSIFYKIVHLPTDSSAIHASYRFYWDDWGIAAHTFDSRYRITFGSSFYVQLHARGHWQSAADFYRPYIGADDKSKYYFRFAPTFVSADPRLNELASVTAGVKVGIKINKLTDISGRLEQMRQRYDNRVTPDFEALIMQFILRIKF